MANLLTQLENNVLLITVNRPEKLNALNHATLTELLHTIEEAKEDDHIRALVITGSGEKAFVAGADIAELAETDAISGLRFAEFGQRVMDAIESSPKPVIAAVNGFALGGGCELAMACHLRLASDNARFGQPEIKLGVIPGFGGTQRLNRLVGKGRAMELNLLGEMIDAPRAEAIGLVNQVLPQAELLPTAMKLASKLAQSAPVALSMIIDSINHGAECALPEALAYEAKAFAVCCATEDKAEGTRAFLEKRAARFSGK